MPSRSKNARAATLSPLAFFSLLRRGRTRRRAGSAKGKGRALGEALRKGKRGKLLGRIRRAHLRIAFGNARAPCREPRHYWRLGKDAPRATRCPRRGQRQGRKISPRSQRRDDQKPEQAKRARPGEARHAVDRLARMSGVGRREADAARGDIPLVEQSMPFLASRKPVEPRKGKRRTKGQR